MASDSSGTVRSSPHRVGVSVDELSFLLYPSEFAGTNKATAVTLKPEDFDAAIGYLRGRGVAFQEFD
jgi:hypothetical protein